MHNVKSLLENLDGKLLLTVVATVHHHRVDNTLNNGAAGLLEALGSIATSRVRKEYLLLQLDVVLDGQVAAGDVFVGPLAKEFDSAASVREF